MKLSGYQKSWSDPDSVFVGETDINYIFVNRHNGEFTLADKREWSVDDWGGEVGEKITIEVPMPIHPVEATYVPRDDDKLSTFDYAGEAINDLSIDDLGLSRRCRNLLFRGEIRKVSDIIGKDLNYLYDIRDLGPVALYEIVNKLKEHGIILKEDKV